VIIIKAQSMLKPIRNHFINGWKIKSSLLMHISE
jgi:hypothetical protein